MLQKVIEYINKYSMIERDDKVIIALSGGPDSICLAHILNNVKDIYGIKLYAVHVNHCLRGAESDEDEAYSKEFCKENGIEFFSKRIDINIMAEERKLSSETAGREARYEYFNEVSKMVRANKIALAHNSNDQAETVLMRIMRGSGLEGLYGIKPVREKIYIRPILGLSRTEIENYCNVNGLNPRVDKTNFENIYNRNKVRLELIPYIQENFNNDIISTLNRLSYIISRDSDFIEEFAQKKYYNYCVKDDNKVIISPKLMLEDEAIISRVIRKAINETKGNLKDIEMIHIYDIIDLFSIGTGKKINIAGNIVCENVYGFVHIYYNNGWLEKGTISGETVFFEKDKYGNSLPVKRFIEEMDLTISVRLVSKEENIKFGEYDLKKYFDYDKIKSNISIRYRSEGDKFIPYGMVGSKKIKDLFMDLKVPKNQREIIPLICFDKEIAWVVGYRASNEFIVTKKTNSILEIKIEKGEN